MLSSLRLLGIGSASLAALAIGGCGSSSSGDGASSSTAAGGSGGAAGGAAAGGSSSGGASTGGASTGGTGPGGGGGASAGGSPGCSASGDLDVGGVWLAQVRFQVKLQNQTGSIVSLCPTDQTGEATFLAIVKMEQSGTSITKLGVTVCDVGLPQVKAEGGNVCDPASAITAQVAPTAQLTQTLPTVSLAPLTGTLSSLAPGADFLPDRIVYVLGSKSSGTMMASWKSSPSCDDTTNLKGTSTSCEVGCVSDCNDVVDTDGDGAPGVTMTVCGYAPDEASGTVCHADDPSMPGVTLQGKAYLNFQVDPQLTGQVDSSCAIHGTAAASILYDVIGGDVRLLTGQLTISQVVTSIPRFQVDPATSRFRAARVDGKYGTADLGLDPADPKAACQAAILKQNTAFP